MATDLRELSFQNVLDTILAPAGVKVGGFPEEIFVDISQTETEQWTCSICYLIVKDSHECINKHLFCHTCIFAWTLTFGENSEKCPVCRCEQNHDYKPNKQTDKLVGDKRVKCPEDDCHFVAPLKIFLMHSHGKKSFSNAHVDLESLRPPRPRLLAMPMLITGGISRSERGVTIRQQLQQGRVMIHQMMLLLHMEMQLRQQALVGYTQAQDPTVRLQRLDEVLALNEQLNEVGGILSTLLNTPLNRLSSAVRDRPSRLQGSISMDSGDSGASGGGASAALLTGSRSSSLTQPRARGTAPVTSALDSDSEDDDDDDSSDSSSDGASPTLSMRRFGPGMAPRPSLGDVPPMRPRSTSIPRPIQPTTADGSTGRTGDLPQPIESTSTPLRRTVVRQSLSIDSDHGNIDTPTIEAPRTQQRALVTRPRTPMRSLIRTGEDVTTSTTMQDLSSASAELETARAARGAMSLPRIENSVSGTTSGRSMTGMSVATPRAAQAPPTRPVTNTLTPPTRPMTNTQTPPARPMTNTLTPPTRPMTNTQTAPARPMTNTHTPPARPMTNTQNPPLRSTTNSQNPPIRPMTETQTPPRPSTLAGSQPPPRRPSLTQPSANQPSDEVVQPTSSMRQRALLSARSPNRISSQSWSQSDAAPPSSTVPTAARESPAGNPGISRHTNGNVAASQASLISSSSTTQRPPEMVSRRRGSSPVTRPLAASTRIRGPPASSGSASQGPVTNRPPAPSPRGTERGVPSSQGGTDRGTFVSNPRPPAANHTSESNPAQASASGPTASRTVVPNSVVRQKTQVNPRAAVRARRAPLPQGPPRPSRVVAGPSSRSNTLSRESRDPQATTSILQTSGSVPDASTVAAAAPESSNHGNSSAKKSKPSRRPSNASSRGSGEQGQVARPRRRSEIALELRQFLHKD